MRKFILLNATLLASIIAFAQPRVTTPKTDPFPKAIEAVLHDFPANLWNITGDLLLQQGEIDNYASLVKPPGALDCIITRYHSVEDTTASWQAKMFTSEDFNAAAKQYREIAMKLKGCYLKLVDGSIIDLSGKYEAAKEESAFTTSTFRLVTGDERYKEVKVEVEILFLFPQWVVNVNVVSKKKDTLEGYANTDGTDR